MAPRRCTVRLARRHALFRTLSFRPLEPKKNEFVDEKLVDLRVGNEAEAEADPRTAIWGEEAAIEELWSED